MAIVNKERARDLVQLPGLLEHWLELDVSIAYHFYSDAKQ
jgi:hypothetical protein